MIDALKALKQFREDQKSVVVYTAIFGSKDMLRELTPEDGVRYVCFSDVARESESWEVVLVDFKTLQATPRKTARWHKTHPHILFPDTNIVIWKDAHLDLVYPVKEYIRALGTNDIAFTEHSVRNCIYKEAEVCYKAKLDDPKTIQDQVAGYQKQRYPVNNGLVATGLTVYRNVPRINNFCNIWWNEIDKKSVRDQLSCNFVLWKLKMPYNKIPVSYIQKVRHTHQNGNHSFSHVVVVIPYVVGDLEQALRTKKIMEVRAGVPCEVIIVEDTNHIGWVAVHNQMARELHYDFYLYSCSDYFPGRDYLKIALDYAKKSNKMLVGFNDGKWHGRSATAGLIHKDLIPKLYQSNTLFYTGYKMYGADPDLTGRAKVLQEFVYAPEALLLEIDYTKDFRPKRTSYPEDSTLYYQREKLNFPLV